MLILLASWLALAQQQPGFLGTERGKHPARAPCWRRQPQPNADAHAPAQERGAPRFASDM